MYNDEVSSDIQYLVTSIVDVNKQRRRVFVNYEPAFVLYNSEIRKYQIKVDSVIMSDIYNEIITILTKRAKIRAMALLKSHDYTEGRLREKLQANGYPKCCIRFNNFIYNLRRNHIIFILSYASSCLNNI